MYYYWEWYAVNETNLYLEFSLLYWFSLAFYPSLSLSGTIISITIDPYHLEARSRAWLIPDQAKYSDSDSCKFVNLFPATYRSKMSSDSQFLKCPHNLHLIKSLQKLIFHRTCWHKKATRYQLDFITVKSWSNQTSSCALSGIRYDLYKQSSWNKIKNSKQIISNQITPTPIQTVNCTAQSELNLFSNGANWNLVRIDRQNNKQDVRKPKSLNRLNNSSYTELHYRTEKARNYRYLQ